MTRVSKEESALRHFRCYSCALSLATQRDSGPIAAHTARRWLSAISLSGHFVMGLICNPNCMLADRAEGRVRHQAALRSGNHPEVGPASGRPHPRDLGPGRGCVGRARGNRRDLHWRQAAQDVQCPAEGAGGHRSVSELVRGMAHTNGIESFPSMLPRLPGHLSQDVRQAPSWLCQRVPGPSQRAHGRLTVVRIQSGGFRRFSSLFDINPFTATFRCTPLFPGASTWSGRHHPTGMAKRPETSRSAPETTSERIRTVPIASTGISGTNSNSNRSSIRHNDPGASVH